MHGTPLQLDQLQVSHQPRRRPQLVQRVVLLLLLLVLPPTHLLRQLRLGLHQQLRQLRLKLGLMVHELPRPLPLPLLLPVLLLPVLRLPVLLLLVLLPLPLALLLVRQLVLLLLLPLVLLRVQEQVSRPSLLRRARRLLGLPWRRRLRAALLWLLGLRLLLGSPLLLRRRALLLHVLWHLLDPHGQRQLLHHRALLHRLLLLLAPLPLLLRQLGLLSGCGLLTRLRQQLAWLPLRLPGQLRQRGLQRCRPGHPPSQALGLLPVAGLQHQHGVRDAPVAVGGQPRQQARAPHARGVGRQAAAPLAGQGAVQALQAGGGGRRLSAGGSGEGGGGGAAPRKAWVRLPGAVAVGPRGPL